jgi:hypothetical protein
MEFEWDDAKERSNRKKHGIGFRAATRVFLDPFAIELDDSSNAKEPRFNVIGVVDDRVIFVVYAVRENVVRIISARGAEPHEKRKYHEI